MKADSAPTLGTEKLWLTGLVPPPLLATALASALGMSRQLSSTDKC